jgi:hypothetical protein
MENKYFTPDIEDLYVGYKLEIKGPHDVDWQPVVLGKDAIWHQFTNLENLGQAMEQLRVPYLTKEQIEAEGWIEDKGLYKLRKNEDLFFTIDFNTDSYSLIINSYSKINTTYYSGDHVFKGFCKDINTFRKIIKLLGI